jgi:1-acyl-sn-glycerol-3-phosphate acyltransferase
MSMMPSRILNWGFRRYVRRFVRKNFNAVRISGLEHLVQLANSPIVCFANHPGWWDPMTAVLLTDLLLPDYRFAAPMDSQALRSYPILERLGFFSVQRDTAVGAKEFLKTSRQLLENQQTILWLTPTGKFHDVRQPVPFMKGLSHLINSEFRGAALPMAIEYTFWNERYPELMVRFDSPINNTSLPMDRDARTHELETSLWKAQASLAELAMSRDPSCFTTLALGRAGVGGGYDLWRRAIAKLRGQKFHQRHGMEMGEPEKIVRGGLL